MKWPARPTGLPWRCLLVALSLALGLGIVWAGWRHWRVADARLSQQRTLAAHAQAQQAALQQRQQQHKHDAPLWHTLRQRGWLAPENRLAALDILAQLPRQPGVQHARAQLGPRQRLSWPWPPDTPLAHSLLHIQLRLSHPRHLADMLAPLASLPGLMLPTACQWRRQATDDDTVDGECQLAWISQTNE